MVSENVNYKRNDVIDAARWRVFGVRVQGKRGCYTYKIFKLRSRPPSSEAPGDLHSSWTSWLQRCFRCPDPKTESHFTFVVRALAHATWLSPSVQSGRIQVMALADLLLLRSLIHSGGVQFAAAAAGAAATAAGCPVAAVARCRPGLGRFAVGLHRVHDVICDSTARYLGSVSRLGCGANLTGLIKFRTTFLRETTLSSSQLGLGLPF